MNSNKLIVFNLVVSIASLGILTVFAVKGMQASQKVDDIQTAAKNIVKNPVSVITSFFQR